jgi:hypothetical protein
MLEFWICSTLFHLNTIEEITVKGDAVYWQEEVIQNARSTLFAGGAGTARSVTGV